MGPHPFVVVEHDQILYQQFSDWKILVDPLIFKKDDDFANTLLFLHHIAEKSEEG